MASEYIELDLVIDSNELANVAFSYLEDVIPGWTARTANVITVMLESNAQLAAELLDQASPIPPAVYSTIAETIYGIHRLDAIARSRPPP